jgi:hypothetical protein
MLRPIPGLTTYFRLGCDPKKAAGGTDQKLADN